jgi:hypothetical protein
MCSESSSSSTGGDRRLKRRGSDDTPAASCARSRALREGKTGLIDAEIGGAKLRVKGEAEVI